MKHIYEESDALLPMIFILTSGNNPQSMIRDFSLNEGIDLNPISLGKDQGEKASRILKEYSHSGG